MKIPCRTCASCQVVSDFTVTTCECGEDMSKLLPVLVETKDITIDDLGEINEGLEFYVQKCSYCGTLSFTQDPEKPVRVCRKCTKSRIATVKPTKYQEPKAEKPVEVVQIPGGPQAASDDDDDDDDGDGAATAMWGGILGGTKQVVQSHTKTQEPADDDDDDDDPDGGWGKLLGPGGGGTKKQEEKKEAKKPAAITLTALSHGTCSLSIKAAEAWRPVMLGRSALGAKFLEQDDRVSNDHCEIWCKDGKWYVRDNHSTNGTFLNKRDLGLNGESVLKGGDILTLGHARDSISFSLEITG